jgi:basic amino acid/polyamine antiporter, APA family
MALTVGIVIGSGIFGTPSLVAGMAGSQSIVMLAWILGGVVSFIGSLVYAELASTYPHAGGDYHYLMRAFGDRMAFLFAWARMSVIQTGSIAFSAFIFGDYMSRVLPLGGYSPAIYAALLVVALTGVNIIGVREGTGTQKLLASLEVIGVLMLIVVGLALVSPAPVPAAAPAAGPSAGSFGLIMVFVLLTYGGWNEAAYVSAELQNPQKNIVRGLLLSILAVTVLYVLVNLAYLRALGVSGIAQSQQVAADVMRIPFGELGATIISVFVAISASTTANASVFTGSRSSFALGRSFSPFARLGHWNPGTGTPVNALLVQGGISLALVFLGALTRNGFQTMVDYTAPVFWFFFMLTGVSLFVLRKKEPAAQRPFRVPLYPVTPLLFCLTSAYLLYSSLAYTGVGAMVGVVVLIVGVLLMLLLPARRSV